VDDHTLVRAGIRYLLEEIPSVRVVAEAVVGDEAVHMAEAHRPNVVLIVVTLAGLSCLETTARLVERSPGARVVILSMHAGEEFIAQALRAGARGFLMKRSAPSELEKAIQAVLRGETYLSPVIPGAVIERSLKRLQERKSSWGRLTPRQREVLQSIAEGKTTKEIALDLRVSAKTVEFHRSRLMERLGIRDVPGLVRYAMRLGLVPLEA
jgi:DNA-binding NarL/FixJ family response regulator